MKILFLFLLALLFIGCGDDASQTAPESETPNYTLAYNEDATEISGEILFDLGTVFQNHSIELSSLVPTIEGCSVDYSASSVTPESMLFSSTSTTASAKVNIKLLSSCTNTKLTMKAKQYETTTLGTSLVTNTKELLYNFSITKITSVSSYTPILKNSSLEVTKNSQSANIIVSVFDALNRPAVDGSVSVIYPNIVKEGIDVGSFTPTVLDVKDGVASFTYTAPSDLSSLSNTATSFQFYYNDDVANSTSLELSFKPDPDQVVHKIYSINLQPQNDEYKMQLEDTKSFSITLVDDDNFPVANEKVNKLSVSLENSFIATLIKSDATEGTSIFYEKENAVTMALKSSTKSGLVAIKVNANFTDVNGDAQDINATLNLVVESGPPTAISISYVDTAQDAPRAKFIERFAISVTDKYLNPVNTNPSVSVGAIIGYAHYSTPALTESNRIFMNNRDGALATLSVDALDIAQDIDLATTDIDVNNDILVTFGDGYRYPASGGWLFNSFSKNSLPLLPNQYTEESTDKLGYAIGHNYRQDQCRLGVEWIGQTTLQDGVSKLDEKGTAIAELTYDYYLVGKDILFYANIIGHDNKLAKDLRVGEAKKHTLRGHGIKFGEVVALESKEGSSSSANFFLWLKDTGGDASSGVAYRNANFTYEVKAEGEGHVVIASKSDSYSCGAGGHANVFYTITSDLNSSYSITLSKPTILNEF